MENKKKETFRTFTDAKGIANNNNNNATVFADQTDFSSKMASGIYFAPPAEGFGLGKV